jgi:hypothetical protein
MIEEGTDWKRPILFSRRLICLQLTSPLPQSITASFFFLSYILPMQANGREGVGVKEDDRKRSVTAEMFIAMTKGGLVLAAWTMDIVPFLTGFYSEQRIDKSPLTSLLKFRVIMKQIVATLKNVWLMCSTFLICITLICQIAQIIYQKSLLLNKICNNVFTAVTL